MISRLPPLQAKKRHEVYIPAKQLDAFIARYTPEIAALARTAFAKLQERLPGAVMMVYDNFNALVIGFAPGDRPSEAILSLVLHPR